MYPILSAFTTGLLKLALLAIIFPIGIILRLGSKNKINTNKLEDFIIEM
jgi:hypothetical protein